MKHSNHGWNKSFFQWITKVKIAKNQYKHLVTKLEYYKSQLTSLKGTSYDQSPSSSSNIFQDKSFYWLSKIEETESEIQKVNQLMIEFNAFVSTLNEQEQKIMQDVIMDGYQASLIAKEVDISRTRLYDIKNSIIRKWMINHLN